MIFVYFVSMIFRTIQNDLNGTINKIGILKKSFAELKTSMSTDGIKGFLNSISPKITAKDISFIKEYNRLVGVEGVSSQTAWYRTMMSSSYYAQELFKDENNLIRTNNGLILSEEALARASNTATLAAKAQSAALKALSIAGNIAMMIAISKAIQLTVSAYDNYVHRLDNAKEALDSSAESYEKNKKEIEELQKQVDECATSIANLEKLEKDGSISIIQQDELNTLRQTNEELQRELLIKQELAKVDARKTADDASKLFNTAVKSEYAGNIYYKSRILGDVSQQQELEFSIEEYQRLAEQQKQNDLAYANGEIS